jgi:hypothetical protein
MRAFFFSSPRLFTSNLFFFLLPFPTSLSRFLSLPLSFHPSPSSLPPPSDSPKSPTKENNNNSRLHCVLNLQQQQRKKKKKKKPTWGAAPVVLIRLPPLPVVLPPTFPGGRGLFFEQPPHPPPPPSPRPPVIDLFRPPCFRRIDNSSRHFSFSIRCKRTHACARHPRAGPSGDVTRWRLLPLHTCLTWRPSKGRTRR